MNVVNPCSAQSLIASKYLTVDKLVCVEGVAVGCGWQAFVAYVNVGCYYLVGVPLGVLLGFKSDLGAKGIWSGMLGGTILQTIILLWVTLRADWEKEVQNAQSRLSTWDEKRQPLLLE
ncbi:hypothetical protein OIU85_005264 [Salix viminalis]|uniref:Protein DETOXIFICATION n=1 Tax=Salix viminalis TaxID=40686 RepID=A0A9Q0NI74_SALVM|nr:hypothetical protein OIU85_005264 [Salix viminalis]